MMATRSHALLVASRARTNPYYRAALEASPQYVTTLALHQKLAEAQRTSPGVPAVLARVRDARADAIRAQMVHCDKIIEDLVTVETDRILGYLSEALTTVMDQVADVVEHLDGARTPQQVIDAGVGDAWRELSPLRDEYDQIRTAQEWAMSGDLQLTSPRSKYLLDDPLATDTAIANLDDVFPAWREPDNTHSTFSTAPQTDPRPWPQDPVEQLVWLAASEAQPWVPTSTDLNWLHAERRKRADPQSAAVHTNAVGQRPRVAAAVGGA
jgi:hypothetical protein